MSYVVMLVTLVTLLATSNSFQQCEHIRKHHQPYARLYENVGPFIHDVVRLKLAVACGRETMGQNDGPLIAIFTMVLALFTIRLARSTDRLEAGASDTARRQLRAYVMVESARVDSLAPGGIPRVYVTIKNYGQTPAYDVEHVALAILDRYPHTVDPPAWDFEKGGRKSPLGPGAATVFDQAMSQNLTARDVFEMRQENLALYAVGHIRYCDAFGETRYTHYWMFTGGPNTHRLDLSEYATGNSAT